MKINQLNAASPQISKGLIESSGAGKLGRKKSFGLGCGGAAVSFKESRHMAPILKKAESIV